VLVDDGEVVLEHDVGNSILEVEVEEEGSARMWPEDRIVGVVQKLFVFFERNLGILELEPAGLLLGLVRCCLLGICCRREG
jgi:hypothetical protein